jgi:hypothetical protein
MGKSSIRERRNAKGIFMGKNQEFRERNFELKTNKGN